MILFCFSEKFFFIYKQSLLFGVHYFSYFFSFTLFHQQINWKWQNFKGISWRVKIKHKLMKLNRFSPRIKKNKWNLFCRISVVYLLILSELYWLSSWCQLWDPPAPVWFLKKKQNIKFHLEKESNRLQISVYLFWIIQIFNKLPFRCLDIKKSRDWCSNIRFYSTF